MAGKPLDDATIERYIRTGRYGSARQAALLAAEKKPTKKQRKVAKNATIDAMRAKLEALL